MNPVLNTVLQYVLYLVILVVLAIPLGAYIGRVMNGEKVPVISKVLVPCENLTYRILRVKKDEVMTWKKYLLSVLLFNGFGLIVLWAIFMLQGVLPGNPMGNDGQSWHLAFNTASSFVTNTNWQAYSGEIQATYTSQALGLTVQNFVSAATGIAVLFALVRAFTRVKEKTLGSFWVDLTRSTLYVLMPLSILVTIGLVSQGTIQTFKGPEYVQLLEPIAVHDVAVDADGNTIENAVIETNGDESVVKVDGQVVEDASVETQIIDGAEIDKENNVVTVDGQVVEGATIVTEQVIPRGPGASQISIKQLGTNGGGFYGVNSAHPLENPTAFSNLLEMISLLLIPAALCFSFGRNVKNKKQGIALFMAMFIMLVIALAGVAVCEQQATPQLAQDGAVNISLTDTQSGGNMEGKEARFGIATSATWASFTTAASNGSVNSMHDSYTPIGGMIPMLLMMLGEVVFGGVGCGLYGLLGFAILTVFIAGLMVGRTPEFMGKKIEPYEMKWACLVCLATPIALLIGAGIAAALPQVQDSLNNSGAHGLSEVLYTYASTAGNNGSAFAGFNANTPFLNVSTGLVMLFVRFIPITGILAIAGSLVQKKKIAVTAGTLSTTNAMFVFLLILIVLLVGALSFLPALALGPLAEFFQMIKFW